MNKDRSHPASDEGSPQGESPVRVLAAVITENGRYLVALRPRHKRHGGFWEFPGGKVELGESLFDIARREVREELGVGIAAVGKTILVQQDPGSRFIIEFVEVRISGLPEAREHDDIRWATSQELLDLQLAPSDRVLAQELARRSLDV